MRHGNWLSSAAYCPQGKRVIAQRSPSGLYRFIIQDKLDYTAVFRSAATYRTKTDAERAGQEKKRGLA